VSCDDVERRANHDVFGPRQQPRALGEREGGDELGEHEGGQSRLTRVRAPRHCSSGQLAARTGPTKFTLPTNHLESVRNLDKLDHDFESVMTSGGTK
jgi:hypothetical protein